MGIDEQTSGGASMDVGRALQRLAGDVDLLQEIVEIFLDLVPERLDELDRSLATGDAAEVANGAHEIKGSASAFCAERMAAVATALEQAARSGALQEATQLAAAIRDEFERLRDQLSAVDWPTLARLPGR